MSREYFARVAPEWDRLREGFFSEALRAKAIALAQLKPRCLAADIGAGTGFMSEGLVAAKLDVIAVDESAEMLAEARRKLGSKGRVSFKLGRAEKIPLAGASVDGVFANMLLHHLEDPRIGIGEMKRILRPGGPLVVTDLERHEFEFLRVEQQDKWLGFDRAEVKAWMVEAGLVGPQVVGLNESCCSKSKDGELAEVSILAAVGWKPVRKTIK